MKPVIITAVVIQLRYPRAEICAECLRPITARALRVCEKDEHGIAVHYYHDAIETVDEIRGCAPDNAMTRKALRPAKVRA